MTASLFIMISFFFFQANLKEEIKQLQDAEQQVKSRVNELTQKKETCRVRETFVVLIN